MTGKTPEWAEVKSWAEEEIERASCDLEVPGTDQTRTEALRARILALRELIDLPNKSAPPEVPIVPDY